MHSPSRVSINTFNLLRRGPRHLFLSALFLLAPPLGWAQSGVFTQHYDNTRSGANLAETLLNTTNVNVNAFGKIASLPVTGQIYAQPLYVPNVSISGGTHNVLYVATEHNMVYAFDADGITTTPYWSVNLGPSAPSTGSGSLINCTDLTPEVGITSCPVIDPTTNTMYLVNKTFNSSTSTYAHCLHALDITTGAESFGGPITINASVPGTGDESSGGSVTFNGLQEFNRPALLEYNGVIYIAFGSHCDHSPYHGWLLGYDSQSLQQVFVYNSTPNGNEGAIWMAGEGPVMDAYGNLYVYSANGTNDVATASPDGDYAMSLLKIALPSTDTTPLIQPTPADYFTPWNYVTLSSNDSDTGTSGVELVPGTNLAIGSSKTGTLDLLDRNNLGQFHSGSDSQAVQEFVPGGTASSGGGKNPGSIWVHPLYWNPAGSNGPFVYLFLTADGLRQYELSQPSDPNVQPTPGTDLPTLNPTPYAQTASFSGGYSCLSANGGVLGTGIIWIINSAGKLEALDASNIANTVWTSSLNSARDAVGTYNKFTPPLEYNGKVYMASSSGNVMVYGLLTITSTPTGTLSPTITPTNSPTKTPSRTPTNTKTITPTNTPTNSPTNTSSVTTVNTATFTATSTPTNTPTLTPTISPTNSTTLTPTVTNTPWNTCTPTFTPTISPTETVMVSFPVIYPNPATGLVPSVILLPIDAPASVKIMYFTVANRRVNSFTVQALPGAAIILPLTDGSGIPLANGLFFVSLDLPTGRQVVKFLVLR